MASVRSIYFENESRMIFIQSLTISYGSYKSYVLFRKKLHFIDQYFGTRYFFHLCGCFFCLKPYQTISL